MQEKRIKKALLILIGISTLVRGFLACSVELGNDEVYYWTYALYPDLSHFDHPPMVGFTIQFFSLNLLFDSELFLRLGSILLGSVNTWIIFVIGHKIKDHLTGFYAAVLYTSSIYCFIIAGVFILPDTPQLFFWLLSIYFITLSILHKDFNQKAKNNLIWAGLFIGISMLSKYTSIFIWIGTLFYILFYDRKWLKTKSLYISLIVSSITLIPILYWNINNNFISFTFQTERVNLAGHLIRFDFALMEIIGGFLYNNPLNVIISIISIISFATGVRFLNREAYKYLLSISLPLIIIFIIFSFFRRTLPHWTGPAHMTLILVSASYLSSQKIKNFNLRETPKLLKQAILLILIVIIIGYVQIQHGIVNFYNPKFTNANELGQKDISLDLFGWKQIGEEFKNILARDIENKDISHDPMIVTYRWFPAANLDYYVAQPNNIKLMTIGPLNQIHKYYWINEYRGGFKKGTDAYFITTSRDFKDPEIVYKNYFEKIRPSDTIQIYRGDKHVMNAFVYRMINLQIIPKIKTD